MRKHVLKMGTLSLLLVLGPQAIAQEKAPKWLDPIVSSLQSGKNLGATHTQRLAIEEMHNHSDKLRRLEAQGLNEAEIRAHFESRAAKSAPMRIAGPFASTASGAISGTLSEVGGSYIQSYASVTAYDEFGNYAGYDSTNASEKGKYRIEGLARGKYYVRAGSYSYGYKYFRDTTDWRKAKLVSVKNKAKKGINFRFEISRGSGSISGTVRRTSGVPIPEAEVSAYDTDYDWIGSGTTDETGQYIITDLPSGEYVLQASYRLSGAYGYRWYKNTSDYENADPVQVTEPETTSGINFVIPFGGTISGKIISSTGKAVGPYEASVSVYDTKQSAIRTEGVGEKGRFILPELRPGKYKLHIEYHGQDNNLSGWYPNAPSFKKAKAIQIASHQNKSLRVRLKPGATITGLVTNYDGQPPPQGCNVRIYDLEGRLTKYGQVRADGTYAASSLPSGSYKVFFDTTYSSSYPGTSPCSEWYGGSLTFEEAKSVYVKVPQTIGDIDIQLDQGGYIAGHVTSEWQSNLAYAGDVYVYDMKGNYVRDGDIWHDNSYMVDGLPSGTYKLLASSWAGDYYMSEWYENKQNFEAAFSMTITRPGGIRGVDISLEPRAYVSGLLADNKGNRLSEEDVYIQVYAFDSNSGEYVTYDSNTFSGGYRLGLLRGSFKLAAIHYYRDRFSQQQALGRTFYPRGTEFYSPENHLVWTAPMESKKLNKIVMNSVPGSVSGAVFDQNTGLPLEMGVYVVMAFDQNGFLAAISGYTQDEDPLSGKFKLSGLRPGTYYLVLMALYDCTNWGEQYVGWYNGLSLTEEEAMLLSPKTVIPNGATAVIVGDGDTGGIDFYVKK